MTSLRALSIISLLTLYGIYSLAQSGPEGDHHVGYISHSSLHTELKQIRMEAISWDGDANYVAGPLDSKVWDLESHINDVREKWLASDQFGKITRAMVRQSALQYGQALTRVPDRDLALGGLIVKSEYSCFAFVIAAANDTSIQAQLSFAQTAEIYCRKASFQLHKATEPNSTDRNAKTVAKWAKGSEEQPRITYLLAMSKCLQATTSGNKRLKTETLQLVRNDIPTYYLNRYPPNRDFVLNRCMAH